MFRRIGILGSVVAAVSIAGAPGGAAAPTSPPGFDAASIHTMLERVVDATDLPGLAAVATVGDRVVYSGGFGHESTGVGIDDRSRFRIASVSKSITAAAVLQLVESGSLRLDDRVVDVVPEFDLADERAEQITVRHLLLQTSGLQDTGIPVDDAATTPDLTRYVAALSPGHLTADPGKQFAYCNANYDIAARVVEVASGVPFAEYMRVHIFDPLGMSDTTIGDADRPTSNGYISVYPGWLPVAENGRFFMCGAGGVVSTAADMGKWLLAQNGNRPDVFGSDLLSTARQVGPGGKYAMGWLPSVENGRPMFEHPGNLFTYTADNVVIPEQRIGFAVFANSTTTPDVSYQAVEGLKALAAGQDPASPRNDARSLALAGYAIAGLTLLAAVFAFRRLPRWHRASRNGRPFGTPPVCCHGSRCVCPLRATVGRYRR